MDDSRIHLSKKLVGIEHRPNKRVRILFEDGVVDEVDLVVAADGIRSVRRPVSFGYRSQTNFVLPGCTQTLLSGTRPSLERTIRVPDYREPG